MDAQLFAKSVELMVVGMGVTFAFLILLVFVLNLLKWGVRLINKIYPEHIETVKAPALPIKDDTKLKIAIALAAIKASK